MDFEKYFNSKNLKKTPRVGIHYEQKTTPDLIWCVALVILDITKEDRNKVFSDLDVRNSSLFNSLMQDYFSKAPQIEAEDEYNKVSSYQLGLLSYAGVLEQVSSGPKKYKIIILAILEYLAINDFNAVKFLGEYTKKFLKDNSLLDVFDNYKLNPSQDNYQKAKDAYWEWAKINTDVRGTSRDHTYRVFNKIFNVFCYENRIPGEDASNITGGICPYSFLIYNRTNFRDENMPPGMTRQQYKEEVLSEIERNGVVSTLLQKVKNTIKQKYGNESEIKDLELGYMSNSGVHVHHILPVYAYPQFSLSKENLISLTPGQHLSFAHVKGKTRAINPEFQIICLKNKFQSIKQSINDGDGFYDINSFISILNTCFNWNLEENSSIETIESNFEKI